MFADAAHVPDPSSVEGRLACYVTDRHNCGMPSLAADLWVRRQERDKYDSLGAASVNWMRQPALPAWRCYRASPPPAALLVSPFCWTPATVPCLASTTPQLPLTPCLPSQRS